MEMNSAAPKHTEQSPADIEQNALPPPTDENVDPDGGCEAWLTVFGSWCCNFSSFGWASSIGIFQTYYAQNQLSSYGSAAISWIPSTNLFMMLVLAPIFGKAFDSYGPRKVILFGSTAHILGLAFLSLSTEYYQILLSQSVLSGMGACAVCYASNNAVSTYFSRRRAFALGIAVSGSSVGGTVIPIIFNRILASGVSFAWTIRILMFIFMALLSAACATCSSRIVHAPAKVSFWEFIRPFTQLPFLLVTMAAFCVFWGIYIPNNFIILSAEAVGLSSTLANYQLTILNAMSMVGRILSGLLADRYGRFNIMVVNLGLVVAFILGLWLAHSSSTTIAFSVLFGFGSGCFISLLPAIIAQISDIKEIGVRVGMVYFAAGFASLTGNPIGGSLVRDDGKNYVGLQVFCGVAIAVGAFIFILARMTQDKKLIKAV